MLKIVFFLLLTVLPAVSMAQTAEEWLVGINEANRKHQFDGTLTYEFAGRLQTAKLEHRIINNVAYQSLTLTDSTHKPIVRRQSLLNCSSGPTRWGLWPEDINFSLLKQGYRFEKLGTEQLAGRATQIIGLIPKDRFHYGYRFSIDQQTGLMIMRVRDYAGKTLDRTRFVDFTLLDNNAKQSIDTVANVWRIPEAVPCTNNQFETHWTVEWLPLGFVSVGNRVTDKGEQVLMFSDGLATLSVFIAEPVKQPLRVASGTTMIAMSSVNSGKDKHTAIVIGDLPLEAVEKVAASVKRKP